MKNLQEFKNEILRNTEEGGQILVDEGIYEDIEEYIEEQKESLDDSINRIEEEMKKIYSSIMNEEEIKLTISNFQTNGTASLTILSLLGFELVEDKEDEDAKIILVGELEKIERKEIEGLLEAMEIANYRHNHTNYDNIDKSSMNNEQVSRLRRGFN